MAFTDKTEKGFETLIVNWLVDQNGYEQGTNDDYSKEYAVDETRLFRFLNDTQPREMAKLGVNNSDQKKRQFLNRLSGEIAKRGIGDKVKIIEYRPMSRNKRWHLVSVLEKAV